MRILLALTLLPAAVAAQQLPLDAPLPLPGVTGYSSSVPTPEQVIGHRIGTQHTRPDQAVRYLEALSEAAPQRVTFFEHGRSFEGRRMAHAIFASPANTRRLEDIQRKNELLSLKPGDISDKELEDMPAVIWMGYGVHGNESSATEAAVVFAYHLAAGQGPAVQDVLENCVVIIDPCYNPDGRARFVNWVNSRRGSVATTDLQDIEHSEPWPGGRTSHYWFDLNRDWMPLTQVESQQRHVVWNRWRPQVTTDYHEQGSNSNYFFQPGIQTRVNPNTPRKNQELTARIAEYHVPRLEAVSELYFTEERFDDFYIGKGSTYPDVSGSIGILFEQAGTRSLATPNHSRTLTYAISIRNQVATSITTLQASVDMRTELLRHMRDFYRDSLAGRGLQPGAGLEFTRTPETADRLMALLDLLGRQRINVYRNSNGSRFWVPFRQSEGRLLQTMFDRRTEFEDDQFYDISAWTLDYAYDVDAEWSRAAPSGNWTPVSSDDITPESELDLVEPRDAYAYVLDWRRRDTPPAAHFLQKSGLAIWAAVKPFKYDMGHRNGEIRQGDIVVPALQDSADAERIAVLMRLAAKRYDITVTAIPKGRGGEVLRLGGSGIRPIPEIKVGIMAGPGGVSSAGEMWHLLDGLHGMEVSMLDPRDLAGLDLSRYTHLLANSSNEKIADWVRGGGTLITWSASAYGGLNGSSFRPDLSGLPYDALGDERNRHSVPGTIFQVEFDTTHPLSFGIGEDLPVFVRGSTFYADPGVPGQTVARFSDDPLMAGYMSRESQSMAPGKAFMLAKGQGRGQVIWMGGLPHFRAFWLGTNRLLTNSIFFGPLL